jgi:hypothetical protein
VSDVSSQLDLYAFVGILVLLALVRAVRMARGTSANPARLGFYAGIYVFLFLLVVGLDLAPLPLWFLAVDAALAVAGGVVATFYVRKAAQITRTPAGGYVYRLGLVLPLIYLSLFVVRIVLDLSVLGEDPFATPPTGPTTVNAQLVDLLALVDVLFAFSTGLIVGRSLGVYLALREHQRTEGATAPVPPAPPPGTPLR